MRIACLLTTALSLWLLFAAAGICRQTPPSSPAQANRAAKKTVSQSSEEKRKTTGADSVAGASKSRKLRQPPASTSPGTPKKIVVREGGANEPAEQIVPGMTPAETTRQRHNAESWLISTDAQLKQLANRKLNPQQQETVAQIHNYRDGARQSLEEGDVQRASTLAEKAHLLADDLLEH
jgi:hypothetical protein